MAQSKRSAASYVAESRNTKKKNPFLGKTMAEMKKMWRGMTPAQRKANEKNFVNAAKTAPKAKPAASKPAVKAKPAQTKPAASKSSGSGVHGQFRKVGDPGPNVTVPYGQLDRSGARVRRNQQDARRSRTNASSEVRAASGSNRRNEAAIKAEVNRSSGGSRESQRAKERRQRLARQRAARRNRTLMLSNKYNKE